MALLASAALTAGLIWPGLAMTLLQALVVAIALAYVAARLHGASLPTALTIESYSPFDSATGAVRPVSTPAAVRDMAALLKAVEDPQSARRASIPAGARRILTSEASRRLRENHRLSVSRMDDQPRIRALVSDATWSLLGTTGRVQMEQLAQVLDDVERL